MGIIKKTLVSLLLVASLLSPIKAKEIEVKTTEELESALLVEGTKEEPTIIRLNNEEYSIQETIYLENKSLIGINSPMPLNKLSSDSYLLPPKEGAKLFTTIVLRNNSKLENLILEEKGQDDRYKIVFSKDNDYTPFENIEISNCYIIGNGLNVFSSPGTPTSAICFRCNLGMENINIRNNIILNENSRGISINYNIPFGNPMINGNIIYGCDTGIKAFGISRMFLGDLTTRGDNTFLRNKWNMSLVQEPKTIPAQWNRWYDTSGTLLTTEEDIWNTLEFNQSSATAYRQPNSQQGKSSKQNGKSISPADIKPIEVMPCYTTPYQTITRVKNWEMWE